MTRIGRCCPKPLRNPTLARTDGDPSCPVLDVPGWFWEAVDLGAVIESGAVSPADLTGRAWQLGIVALAELGQARRVAEWEADQRRAAVERLRRSRS